MGFSCRRLHMHALAGADAPEQQPSNISQVPYIFQLQQSHSPCRYPAHRCRPPLNSTPALEQRLVAYHEGVPHFAVVGIVQLI